MSSQTDNAAQDSSQQEAFMQDLRRAVLNVRASVKSLEGVLRKHGYSIAVEERGYGKQT